MTLERMMDIQPNDPRIEPGMIYLVFIRRGAELLSGGKLWELAERGHLPEIDAYNSQIDAIAVRDITEEVLVNSYLEPEPLTDGWVRVKNQEVETIPVLAGELIVEDEQNGGALEVWTCGSSMRDYARLTVEAPGFRVRAYREATDIPTPEGL